jgi:radical SAM-linked protein
LPWSAIRLHVSAEGLRRERNRTSTTLSEKVKPIRRAEPVTTDADDDDGFGRSRKKVAQKVGFGSVTSNIRIRWGRKGLARFFSHRDNMRVLERSIRRADIPAAFTKGFHPHMKMAFGPPLPVGYTSEAEYLDLTLERPFQPDMAQKLSRQLPSHFFMTAAQPIINTRVSLSGKLNRAVYEVVIDEESDMQSAIDDLMGREIIEIERETKDATKLVDIRPAIYVLEYDSSTRKLYMELGIGAAGYVRPTEILQVLGVVDADMIPALIIHRKDLLYIDDNGKRLIPMEF